MQLLPYLCFLSRLISQDKQLLVLEYCSHGDLIGFLRKNRNAGELTQQIMLLLCSDIAAGMEAVGSLNIVHRDLAARNCLVTSDMIVKVADFGRSAKMTYGVYQATPEEERLTPVRWTAPEALVDLAYSAATDVWSFGVVLWEVFTCGHTPYGGMSNGEVQTHVTEGGRLPPLEGVARAICKLLDDCMAPTPRQRPTFTEARATLNSVGKRLGNGSMGYDLGIAHPLRQHVATILRLRDSVSAEEEKRRRRM